MNNNIIESTADAEDVFGEETEVKNARGSRFLRGTLIFTIAVSFIIFVYLLLYFSKNTGA